MSSRIRKTRSLRALTRNCSGQAQIEFVLSIVFVILLIFAIIEMIMLIYTYNTLADAAKEGVRYAVVHGCDFGSGNCSGTCTFKGTPSTCSDDKALNVQAWSKTIAAASLHDTSAMTFNVSYPDGSSDAPNRVQVTASYNYQPFFGLGWPTVTVRATAQGRIVY